MHNNISYAFDFGTTTRREDVHVLVGSTFVLEIRDMDMLILLTV